MSSVAAIAGAARPEREAALRRISAPGAGVTGGASLVDETSGSIGTVGAPPSGGGNFRLPGAPNEPNFNTNSEGFVPTTLEEGLPLGGLPGVGRGNGNNEEGAAPPANSFSGNLTGGPGGVGGGGGSAQAAMESLHGGAGVGSGPGASNLTASSRSGISMASQAGEESMLGGNGAIGAGAPGEEGGMGTGANGRREEDGEHKAASYLQEADPDALFGTDEMTHRRSSGNDG